MIATTESVNTSGAKSCDAEGQIASEKRRHTRPPIFGRIAARTTEPAVGASTWASGSQVCTGHIGILTAKEAKNASHAQVCRDRGTAVCISVGISVVPAFQYSAMIASSIRTEPRKV